MSALSDLGNIGSLMNIYHDGGVYGLPASCMVHGCAILAGDITAGEKCRIDPFVTITGSVSLGNNVHIGVGASLFGGAGITIEDGCSVSAGAKLFTATAELSNGLHANATMPETGCRSGPIRIGKMSVIGANSVVLPNVTIGGNVQIGALSLVSKDVPSDCTAVGIPVRILTKE